MAKIYDITDKLSFEENPKILVKGEELEVNTDAQTVLILMNTISGAGDVAAVNILCEHVFTKEAQEKLNAMKLNFSDYSKVVNAGLDLAIGRDPGEEEEQGNEQTPAMT